MTAPENTFKLLAQGRAYRFGNMQEVIAYWRSPSEVTSGDDPLS